MEGIRKTVPNRQVTKKLRRKMRKRARKMRERKMRKRTMERRKRKKRKRKTLTLRLGLPQGLHSTIVIFTLYIFMHNLYRVGSK